MVATAIIGAAVIGGGASIAASSSASHAATNTANQNNQLQRDIYSQNKGNLQPYIDAGNLATPIIQGLLGEGGDPAASAKAFDTYKNSTEYESRLQQGQNSVMAGLGARGLLDSGAGQKALLKYGQTFASNEFGNYYNNLTGQQNTGLTAASALAGVGQNYGNAVNANNNNAANATGNAALANASNINGLLNNAVSAYGFSQGMGSSYGGGHSLGGSPISSGLYGLLRQGNGVG